MLSNLPLAMLIFFNGWFDVLYVAIVEIEYIWKGTTLPYPDELGGLLALEVCLVLLLGVLEYSRLFLASRGNKTEKAAPLAVSCVFSFPCAYLFFYFLFQQVYVTRLDVILAAIGLGFIGLELILSILVIVTFFKASSVS